MPARIIHVLLLWIITACTFAEKSDQAAKDEDFKMNQDFLKSLPYPYEIVYPVQMRMNEVLTDLETRDPKAKTKNAHYHHTNFEILMFNQRIKIKLEQNRELLSSGLKQKHDQDSKLQVVEVLYPENCYYQGQIRKVQDSLVVVSTCKGIRGVILDSKNVFLIQPLERRVDTNETQFPHVVIEVSPGHRASCENVHGMWKSYKQLHQREFLGNVKIMKPQEDDTFENPKYLDMAVVADHAMFEHLNGTVLDSLQYLSLLANIVDALLKEFHIKIRLVYVEVWNQQDHFSVDGIARTTLTNFLQYRTENMIHSEFDFAHFLTGQELSDGKLGMAIPDSICSDRAVAISQTFDIQDPLQVASGVVHMLGHVLGIEHDVTDDCGCNDPYGCIMGQISVGRFPDHAHIWSSCSSRNIRLSVLSRLSFCLSDDSSVNPTFEHECGNGITERGEECDCINSEECEFTDPCCDQKTCLMKPWASCRYGECCHNCTILPNNQVCREQFSQCDVPEFCDGVSGDCPANVLVQDGQTCENDESFCYHGECHQHGRQCKSIWGEDAVAADDNCYVMFNIGGRFNGHCGKNTSTGEYLKCSIENIKCGLLHCANGTDKPLNNLNKTFSITTIASQGNNYQCKIVNGLPDLLHFGMVRDGTKCASDRICISNECIPLSLVMPIKCPIGLNGLICSGRGICTTEVRCFCDYNYTGVDCGQRSNRTFIPITPSTTETPPTPSTTLLTEAPVVINNNNMTVDYRVEVSTVVQVSTAGNRSDSTTLELIIALSSVVACALVVLALCLFCYRRKSPVKTVRKKSIKNQHGSITSFSSSQYVKSRDPDHDPGTSRSISFGPLPSYRADKIKKAMRGGLSETESEHSRGERDSTEIKAAQTLPLAKPPEKGILKKHPRSSEIQRRVKSRDMDQNSRKRESAANAKSSLEVQNETKTSKENTESKHPEESDQPPDPTNDVQSGTSKSQSTSCPADRCSSDDGLDFIDDDASSGSCSCDESSKSPSFSGELENETESASLTSKLLSSRGNHQPSELQTLLVTASVDERKKLMRQNITDLLKQLDKFDEQFNSVLNLTGVSHTDNPPSSASENLQSNGRNSSQSLLPNGILQQKELNLISPVSKSPSSLIPGRTMDTRSNVSGGLPDLLHSGPPKSSSVAETSDKDLISRQRLLPLKGDNANFSQPKDLGQKVSSPSTMLSNSSSKPLSLNKLPNTRTCLPGTLAPSPFTAFVPQTTTSETPKKPVLVENSRVPSSVDIGATGGVRLDSISTVPYRGANTSGSPRLNRRKPVETGDDKNRSDEDSKVTGTALRPSGLSSSKKRPMESSATNNEGCNTDRTNTSEEAIIIREIPVGRELFTPSSHSTSARTPSLLSSPEDIDV